MSDPVSSADIEDVLASIRRLVVQGVAPVSPARVTPLRGRLVLTDAHRVEEGPGEAEAALPSVLVLSAPLRPGYAAPAQGIEAALGERAEAWEPDGSEEADWSLGGALADEPDGEGAEPPVFRHRTAPHRSPAPPAPLVAALPFDEERLRALVLEVVRAELQGELGERITRNVRKLVRREVFRVLESRDDG